MLQFRYAKQNVEKSLERRGDERFPPVLLDGGLEGAPAPARAGTRAPSSSDSVNGNDSKSKALLGREYLHSVST
jgi:hypothetical protein